MKVVIAGGGTGGHLFPGLALAEEFRKRDDSTEVVFVGTDHGLEARVIPREGYPLNWVIFFEIPSGAVLYVRPLISPVEGLVFPNDPMSMDSINSTSEFHKPHYLILNLAIGGNWPKDPDETTQFPDTVFVDYVRVFQK